MTDERTILLERARIALTFYRQWMAKKEPGTTYPSGIDVEDAIRKALTTPTLDLTKLLQHVDDLRAGFSVQSDTDVTMLKLGKPIVERARAALTRKEK